MTSLPAITDGSVKLVGFILAIILIGLRTGSIKATITPFISEPLFKSANSHSKNINLLYDLNRGSISKCIPIGNNHKSRWVSYDRSNADNAVYIYNVFYWYVKKSLVYKHLESLAYFLRFTSFATLSLIPSTYLEKKVRYWAAYLMPLCAFAVMVPQFCGISH